jgi:hypothetical protein
MRLDSIDLSQNTKLTGIACHDNNLKSLDVSKCTALTGLNISGNPLFVLDVSKNKSSLQYVAAHNCPHLMFIYTWEGCDPDKLGWQVYGNANNFQYVVLND